MPKITITKAISTTLAVAKVAKLAADADVTLAHLDTRFAGKGKWINDFEVNGPPGKVAEFLARLDDIRLD
jgi:hypothetical protein